MPLREVSVTITNKTLVQTYIAKSYPMRDGNNDGYADKYEIPIYKVVIEGRNAAGLHIKKEWPALRFMPFWNDPKNPDKRYKTRGYVDSGKVSFSRQAIKAYLPNYEIHNTYSQYGGAIQIEGNFLIHAGPDNLANTGWGGAGCVEIIGSFDKFRRDIMDLAGTTNSDITLAMTQIINYRKLFLEIENCAAPKLKKVGEF